MNNRREQYEMYLRGETDEFPYIDDEEKELIESIENGDNYVEMPEDEMNEFIARLRKGIENQENMEYRLKFEDLKKFKQELKEKGANEKIIEELENFMSDKMMVNA